MQSIKRELSTLPLKTRYKCKSAGSLSRGRRPRAWVRALLHGSPRLGQRVDGLAWKIWGMLGGLRMDRQRAPGCPADWYALRADNNGLRFPPFFYGANLNILVGPREPRCDAKFHPIAFSSLPVCFCRWLAIPAPRSSFGRVIVLSTQGLCSY